MAIAAGVAASSATRTLDRLVHDGLVSRTDSEADRRCVTIALTAEGKRALARKRSAVTAQRRRIAETLTPEEQAQAVVILRRLARVVDGEW